MNVDGNTTSVDGNELLGKAISELSVDLASLVAATTIWAPKEEHNVGQPIYPNIRRAKRGEKRGQVVDGVRFDDNTYANRAFKEALSQSAKFTGFAVCHVWPRTCYDARYHTVLANMVLLPRALASLTDHNVHIERCLKYRSWCLYGWKPEGEEEPQKPENYPTNWLEPIARGTSPTKLKRRPKALPEALPGGDVFPKLYKIKGWANNPDQLNHQIIRAFLHLERKGDVELSRLREYCKQKIGMTTFDSNYASMKTDSGHSHGKVFFEEGAMVRMWPPVRKKIDLHFK